MVLRLLEFEEVIFAVEPRRVPQEPLLVYFHHHPRLILDEDLFDDLFEDVLSFLPTLS